MFHIRYKACPMFDTKPVPCSLNIVIVLCDIVIVLCDIAYAC